jgi:hypothetical protein
MRLAINQGWACDFELVPTSNRQILAVDSLLNKL